MYYPTGAATALRRLIVSECGWLGEKIAAFAGRKCAIFCAGPTARHFHALLQKEFGISAEFFIDNNPALAGTTIAGLPVLREPWASNPNFAEEYFTVVASSPANYREIAKQLSAAHIHAHISWYEYIFAFKLPQILAVNDLQEDDFSKTSYLASIWSMMKGEHTFIQHMDGHYFGHRAFVSAAKQIVVDAGAYVGDNVEDYIRRGFGAVKVYAFEPYEKCLPKLANRKKRLEDEFVLEDENIIIVPAGLAATTTTTTTTDVATVGANMLVQDDNGKIEIPVYSLDDFFKDKKPPTIIKADIEGMELDMLKGAQNIIRERKPHMALSIYHSPMDMFTIAEYVKQLVPEYNFAVRNHWNTYEDTILYCWVEGAMGE